MSDLPDGWDIYDPADHEHSNDPDYQRERQNAAEAAATRRSNYGKSLAALRRARSLTQQALAEQLGVAQGEVSRIEHQSDLLVSTLARYVTSMGGELTFVVRFAGREPIEVNPTLDDTESTDRRSETYIAPNPRSLAQLGALIGRLPSREELFLANTAA